jgi:mRNA interferase RelE/StbE
LGWTIEYDPGAIKDLSKLNRSIQAEVFDYMDIRIAQAESPRAFGKPLRYDKFGLWRYRVRDYRIVCELQEGRQVVLVIGVGHRREVYE